MYQSPPEPARRSPSDRVVAAVADEAGTDPENLPQRLYDAVDPDALDSLFGGRNATRGTVSFVYCGYEVTVRADGAVSVGT